MQKEWSMKEAAQAIEGNETVVLDEPAEGRLYFVRLNDSEIKQHGIFMTCFVILAITGFMLKLPADLIDVFGGAGETVYFVRSLLHRLAGTLMILVALYHVYYVIAKPAGRRWFADMIPRPKDVVDLVQNLLYYVGARKEPPAFDRFSYKEKAEYWALIAGTTLMSLSGILLWTESYWNKFILDIAAIVHSMEAVLACLAIIVWHLYEIHLKPHKSPIDNTWLTGVIDEEEMKHEHRHQYDKIMADPELQQIYLKKESSDE